MKGIRNGGEGQKIEFAAALANLKTIVYHLEISLMASNSRLSLVEAFDNQMAQSQIEIKEVLSSVMHQFNDLKTSQTKLEMRLDDLLGSQTGSASTVPYGDITATLKKTAQQFIRE